MRAGRLGVLSWCLYDWANSAYSTVVTTFVFSTYVTQTVAPDPITGTTLWGRTLSLAAFVGALASPVLGAVADKRGRRKPWMLIFTLLCVLAISAMWLVEPKEEALFLALALFFVTTLTFGFGMVFYNAMLPTLVPRDRQGRVSGWGWGLGYLGGLACLLLILAGIEGGFASWLGLDEAAGEPVRATSLVVALWFSLFALPIFLFTPDSPASGLPLGAAVQAGLKSLGKTLGDLRRYGTVARFLLAHMFYSNGLGTLFAFGAIYAAGTFGLTFADILRFGIALNVSAGLGALAFAWVDDWIGAKRTIQIALTGLIALGTVLVFAQSEQTLWLFGTALGVFVGPAQAASRSFMSRLAPPAQEAEMFGLYELAGKATAFAGPAMLALVTDSFQSQRAGIATILVFLLIGLVLLGGVRHSGR